MTPGRSDSLHALIAASWLAVLMAVQSLPHTGAWRSLFVLLALLQVGALLVARFKRGTQPISSSLEFPEPAKGPTPSFWLALLTAWLIIQTLFIAPDPMAAFGAFSHEWGKLLGMILLGIVIAALITSKEQRYQKWLVTGLFAGYFAHVIFTLVYQAWWWWQTGTLGRRESLLGNYGHISPLIVTAQALLLADLASRLSIRRQLLPISNRLVAAAITLSLLAALPLTAKAGLIMNYVLAMAFLAVVMGRDARHRLWSAGGVVLVLALITVLNIAVENRWSDAWSAIVSAQRVATSPPASSSPAPQAERMDSAEAPPPSPTAVVLEPSAGVDPSFYVRSLSAKIGLQAIRENPLGLGYGGDAYGRHMLQTFGVRGPISSESGWIDFALANGVPGLALLLAWAWALARLGWQAFRHGNPAGLALCFVTINYFVRCGLDGFLAGSRLTSFGLMAGVLWYLSTTQKAQE